LKEQCNACSAAGPGGIEPAGKHVFEPENTAKSRDNGECDDQHHNPEQIVPMLQTGLWRSLSQHRGIRTPLLPDRAD